MNTKLILALTAILAIISTEAQLDAPALSSLASKLDSLSASATGPQRSGLINSALSAYTRISSEIARSQATAVATQSSSLISQSSMASAASSSAGGIQSSAASVLSSVSSAASSVAQSQAPNAGNSIAGMSNTLLLQFSALAAIVIASFVAMLA